MKISHNELFAHKHFVIVVIIILICASTAGMFLYAYKITRDQITTNYRQTFEKKTWSGLEVFHAASQAAIQEYFSKNISVISNVAENTEFRAALEKHDKSFIEGLLKRQLTINQRFNNFGILDNKGIFIFSASSEGGIQKFIGQDFSNRDYFKKAVRKKHPVITTIFGTVSGKDVVIFSAPVIGSDGEVDYVVNGTLFLSTLREKITGKNIFEEFNLMVGDDSGNIIFRGDNDVYFEKAGGYRNPVIERLMNGENEVLSEYVSDEQKIVFAKGTSITFGEDNTFFVVSSYDKNQFEKDIQLVQETVKHIYSQLGIRVLFFGSISALILVIILKRHDAAAHHI